MMESLKENADVCLVMKPGGLKFFSLLLQQGVQVTVKPGCSLKQLLCDQLGILEAYLNERIKTVFLNGKPVDDYGTAIVPDGATLALSAAMPGLVGATFRSGGILSPFRSRISYQNTTQPDRDKRSVSGRVTLKLFNLLGDELGPGLLENGVWVEKEDLRDVVLNINKDKNEIIESVSADGEKVSLKNLDHFLDRLDNEIMSLAVLEPAKG